MSSFEQLLYNHFIVKFKNRFNNHKKTITQVGKRVSYLLKRSFFSVEELLELKKRKAASILRKIAKTEGVGLSTKEAKEILSTFCFFNKKKKIKPFNSLTGFLKLFKFTKEKMVFKVWTYVLVFIDFFKYIFNFRLDDQKIFRN